ncbi:MAG: TIGR01777 family oxidoreductase [Anaerolineales bacterium]
MRVLIAGGSGMIGTALAKSLLAEGHQVWVLTRTPQAARLPQGALAVGWDGRACVEWADLLSQVDAVVNLVGERLSRWPWTKRQKQRFLDSRVEGGRALVQAIQAASPRPRVFMQASGVNYYGPRGLELVTEADGPGNDFLARLCQAWEASTQAVEKLGVRRVILRSAIVLSTQAGILPVMLFPLKWFVGGRLGSGKQGLAWIHLVDEVAAMRFLLDAPSAHGPYNLTAPNPISSAEFLRAAARDLHRPFWLPVPAFALRLALGGMATLVLDGLYLFPTRLQEQGFVFRFGTAEAALHDLLNISK